MKKLILVAALLIGAVVFDSSQAFAHDGKKNGRQKAFNRQMVVVKSSHHARRPYRPSFVWIAPNKHLSIGMIVERLPYGHRTVIIKGATYHCHNNTYYKPYRRGYMVVRKPC